MPGMRGFGMDKVRLLSSDQVRKELAITEEQGTKIEEITTAYREESRGLFSGMGRGQDMSREERQKAREEMTKKREELTKKVETKLMAALQEKQAKRLNEIWLQLQPGAAALTSKYVVDGLKLSKEQVAKIKAAFKARDDETTKLMEEMRAARGEGGRGQGGDRSAFQEMREKMQAIRQKGEDTAMAVLTAEQKAGLEKLKGAKFELDRESFRRGGRGEGGFRRGGTEGGGRRGGRQGRQGGQGGGETI